MNKIFHYRVDGSFPDECAADDPWGQCVINHETNLDDFKTYDLVAIGGMPVISQHEATYITGRDTCHAHHFAKMLAGAVIAGSYNHAPSLQVYTSHPTPPRHVTPSNPGTVLWIDTIHSPYDCVKLYREMKQNFPFNDGDFNLFCLDMLGVFREDYYTVIKYIEDHIRRLKPALIVVDDIDHFMPHCGINVASTFNHIVRDTLNHTESAFLFIGYNHLGKRASTTGDLGKLLFPYSTKVFSVSTQNGISRMNIVRAHEYVNVDKPEFIFSIGDGNLPHELVKTLPSGNISPTFVEQHTMQDIITEVIEPGENLSPDELVTRISNRKAQLNRIDRARTLIAQALTYGLIKKQDGSNRYTLSTSKLEKDVNTSLTLSPHPSVPSDNSIPSINSVPTSNTSD